MIFLISSEELESQFVDFKARQEMLEFPIYLKMN